MGGAIAPGVSGRVALSYRHRDDWVDNTFNGGELGGYDDFAGRAQMLFEPTAEFSALLNLHGRTYEGTSTLFRANVHVERDGMVSLSDEALVIEGMPIIEDVVPDEG